MDFYTHVSTFLILLVRDDWALAIEDMQDFLKLKFKLWSGYCFEVQPQESQSAMIGCGSFEIPSRFKCVLTICLLIAKLDDRLRVVMAIQSHLPPLMCIIQ